MILLAIALSLVAAVLHALWNVLLKTSGDPLRTSARAMAASAAIFTPCGVLVWLLVGRPGMAAATWGLIVLSSFGELGYFLFLSEAYRRGELSVVYPIARGSAPLLAVPAGLLLGNRLSGTGWVGVVCVLAGMWIVRRPSGDSKAVVPALITGVFIAFYTAVNSVGARQAPPWLYACGDWTISALLLNVVVWLIGQHARRALVVAGTDAADPAIEADRDVPDWSRALAIGTPMAVTYLLIITALSLAPLVVVAPVRESAIALVTGWGIWRLDERQGAWLRVAGICGILSGLVLLAI